jgi:hypothetical protein
MNNEAVGQQVATYGGITISFNARNGNFYANITSGIIKSTSLAGIKKQIDEKTVKKNFKSFTALKQAWGGDFNEVVVVGIKLLKGRKVWVTPAGREIGGDLFVNHDDNRRVAQLEKECEKRQDQEKEEMRLRHRDEMSAIRAKYITINPETYEGEQHA